MLRAMQARRIAFYSRWLAALALAVGAILAPARVADADTLLIKRPGAHPTYRFEAEPHVLLGFVDAPGPANGNGAGLGFRGTIELVDNGFISQINNTIGIGFGLDWVRYGDGGRRCVRVRGGPCEFFDDDDGVDYLILPVVMQWNFWLSRNWSVFGEPGIALRFYDDDNDRTDDDGLNLDPFVFYAGGRWHFSDYAALTLRVGYPTFS
ncbi:MAG TPA: hypothetical protein VK524_18270, partial [Polyangiaceae bacterium]|nr:hypothetical protein [Polyangiaceae bacterium]